MQFNYTISTSDNDFATWLASKDDESIGVMLKRVYESSALAKSTPAKSITKPIQKSDEIPKSSHAIGLSGEQAVIDTLMPFYELECRNSHAGDVIVKRNGKSVLVEVKNYASNIPYKEVEKFHSDLDSNSLAQAGLFISLKSSISKVGKSIHFVKRKHQYIVYLVKPSSDIIIAMMNLLFDINEYRCLDGNRLIKEIEKLEELRSCIANSQLILTETKSLFDKNMESLIRQNALLEHRFAESIRKLSTTTVEKIELPTDRENIIDFVIAKFADSVLAKNEMHRSYLSKFVKRFQLSGNFSVKNKVISWTNDYSVSILKTKTTFIIPRATIHDLTRALQYDVKIGETIKIEVSAKNYPFLDHILAQGEKQDLLCLDI